MIEDMRGWLRLVVAMAWGMGALTGARPAHGAFATTTTDFIQCDVMVVTSSCGPQGLAGIAERSDGTVLLGSFPDCADRFFSYPETVACPGVPVTPTLLSSPGVHCMVYGLDGRLYGTNDYNQVLELNPLNGTTLRVVSPSGTWFGADGLTVDPQTGDLYTTRGRFIYRIANPAGPSPVASRVADASASTTLMDGCAFSCDGSYLLAAALDTDRVIKMDRNGTVSILAQLPVNTQPDGICFGSPGTLLFGNAYTNNNDGSVTEVPLANPAFSRTIASGSPGRGDFLTVSLNGDLLACQGDRVIRLRSVDAGKFDLSGSSLCGNLHCADSVDLDCIENHGIRTSIRVAIPFICDPTNPSNARLARTCNSIDKLKKHSPGCTHLLAAFRAMRDYLMTLAATPDCSGE